MTEKEKRSLAGRRGARTRANNKTERRDTTLDLVDFFKGKRTVVSTVCARCGTAYPYISLTAEKLRDLGFCPECEVK